MESVPPENSAGVLTSVLRIATPNFETCKVPVVGGLTVISPPLNQKMKTAELRDKPCLYSTNVAQNFSSSGRSCIPSRSERAKCVRCTFRWFWKLFILRSIKLESGIAAALFLTRTTAIWDEVAVSVGKSEHFSPSLEITCFDANSALLGYSTRYK